MHYTYRIGFNYTRRARAYFGRAGEDCASKIICDQIRPKPKRIVGEHRTFINHHVNDNFLRKYHRSMSNAQGQYVITHEVHACDISRRPGRRRSLITGSQSPSGQKGRTAGGMFLTYYADHSKESADNDITRREGRCSVRIYHPNAIQQSPVAPTYLQKK